MKIKQMRILKKLLATIVLVIIILLNISDIFKISITIAATDINEIHISSSGRDTGDGSNNNPYLTLGKALEVAEDNTTIYLDTDITMGVDNVITKNITIKSNENSTHTLKREQNAEGYCLIIQEGGTLTLDNIIIDGNEEMKSWHPVIRVENSTLNMQNNAIVQNNNSHSQGAISLINSTFNMSGGEIRNNISSMISGAVYSNNSKINISGNASIKNNKVTDESANWPLSDDEKNSAHGGAFYIEEKSILNISENAEISNNTCVLYGGGIFAWGSTINMNGGKISNNNAIKGAGIYCEGGSDVTLSNGEISQNKAKANSTLPDYNVNIGGKGGGIMAISSTISILNSFNISGNEAETDGGGINLNQSVLNMKGGIIDSNIANINGGGIILDNVSSATISAGYITNNVCDLTKFKFDFIDDPNAVLGTMEALGTGSEFAGGGIYLHSGCSLNITNVVITDNTNDQTAGLSVYPDKTVTGYSGNGIAMCPTAKVKVYTNNGGAIYNNGDDNSFDIVAIPNSYVNDYNFNNNIDEKSYPKFYNTNFALGGGFYGWTDFSGNQVLTENCEVIEKMALKSHLNEEDIKKANDKATVFITGNKSKGIFGAGGIVCNGLLTIGTNDNATIKIEKHAEKNALLVTDEFSFDIELKGDEIDKNCDVIYQYDNNGASIKNIAWTKLETGSYKTTITIKVDLEGNGYFSLLNIPNGTEFTITEKSIEPDFTTQMKVVNGEADINGKTAKGVINIDSGSENNNELEDEDLLNVPTLIAIMYNNDYITGNLEVTKTVVNDNTNKAFTFTVTLNNTNINGTYGDMTFENGIATFTLKNGEKKVATNLPVGISFKVTETDNEGYTVTSTGDTGKILQEGITKVSFVNTKINTDNDNTIVNDKVLPQTGYTNTWFIITFAIVLFVLICTYFQWKKNHYIEK